MPTLNQSPEKEKFELENRIRSELRHLHIPGYVHGFRYLTYMLLEVVPDPSRLTLITKNLYPDAGNTFGVSTGSVERDIRTAISICWRSKGRETLAQMACHHLDERPTATEFIDIVADYIRRTR